MGHFGFVEGAFQPSESTGWLDGLSQPSGCVRTALKLRIYRSPRHSMTGLHACLCDLRSEEPSCPRELALKEFKVYAIHPTVLTVGFLANSYKVAHRSPYKKACARYFRFLSYKSLKFFTFPQSITKDVICLAKNLSFGDLVRI